MSGSTVRVLDDDDDDDDGFAAALLGLVSAIQGGATSEEAVTIASAVHDHDLGQYLAETPRVRPPAAVHLPGPMPHYFTSCPPDEVGYA
jgi:hypothetical protein